MFQSLEKGVVSASSSIKVGKFPIPIKIMHSYLVLSVASFSFPYSLN